MKFSLRSFCFFLFQLLIMLVLPFWVLIRGAVFLYEYAAWHPFFALLASGALVSLVLLVYVAMVRDALLGPKNFSRRGLKGSMVFVLVLMSVYTGYALYNLTPHHAKSTKVAKTYQSLHPLLRLSVGTLVLLDRDLLITDVARQKEDYQTMGLPTKARSLHYPQSTGYVHAMDLRTRGHGWVRNKLLRAYFWSMGFQTLRHVGTADHLHVSLSVADRPGAI